MVVKLLAPLSAGASLTLVTVMFDVADAGLNAVVPPLVVVSTLLPWVPEDWSQARKVTDADVLFWPSGTKRNLSVERKSKALLLATAPTLVQVVPASVEYCHVPVLLFKLVRAMPLTAPLSTSETWPLMSVDTRSPLFVV